MTFFDRLRLPGDRRPFSLKNVLKTRDLQTGRKMVHYLVIIGFWHVGRRKGGNTMKGYNDKGRKLFVRITAWVLAVLMVATVFSVLIFR